MSDKKNPAPVIVICGPTGVGKTRAGIEAAERFNGEIIGADSMQIYRYMDIGTAKPTDRERSRIFHHLVDITDPDEDFDAADFRRCAGAAFNKIRGGGKTAFLVGGTGLYIKAFLYGLFDEGAADPAIRERLKQEAEKAGTARMHERLSACDPEAATRLHPNDLVRVLRALEIYEQTGQPMTKLHRNHRFRDNPYRVLKIGLEMEREKLYNRINRRVIQMFDEGLLEETRRLLEMGYTEKLKPMQAIGYRHAVPVVRGIWSMGEAVRTMQRDTRRYAKRQLTWFRADPEVRWATPDRFSQLLPEIGDFLGRT
jgi:tRNA dimethylallyltransferase